MIKVEADNREKFKQVIPFFPKELLPLIDSLNLDDYKYILPRLNTQNLPFNFKLNARGGWITPDGSWYIPSITANLDDTIKPRLKNPQQYDYNARKQALKEGWVRIDWKQPIFSGKFSSNRNDFREFIVTIDEHTRFNYKLFLAIQAIAMLYTIIMPMGFFYELKLITRYQDNKVFYRVKKSRGLEFFNLDLIKYRR